LAAGLVLADLTAAQARFVPILDQPNTEPAVLPGGSIMSPAILVSALTAAPAARPS
jgi:hypothetical protein